MHRAYCTKNHDGAAVSPEEELVIWVPACLLYHAGRDADLRQFLSESMLRGSLFPAKLPVEMAARHWAAIYMSCDAKVGLCPCTPPQLPLPYNILDD